MLLESTNSNFNYRHKMPLDLVEGCKLHQETSLMIAAYVCVVTIAVFSAAMVTRELDVEQLVGILVS